MKPLRNYTTLICLLLAAFTLASYFSITGHQFISFDDYEYIVDNDHVRNGLTWPGIGWALTTGYFSNWHPLTWLSFMLDCQLFGLDAGLHHFTNLLFHVANTLLVFTWLRLSSGSQWRSAFVAALFALHPTHVESVAWASERKDVLCAFFGLLALIAYTRYAQKPCWRKYLLVCFLFLLGLMSKPMLVTLPFVLLLMDYWPLHRFGGREGVPSINIRQAIGEKLPLFALAALSSFITVVVQHRGGAVADMTVVPLSVRISNVVISYVRYVSKTFWPTDLAFFYPLHRHPLPMLVVSCGFLLAIWSILALLVRRRWPYIAVGWFWFLGTLVPVIGLVQVGGQSLADRYLYIPATGLFIIAAWIFPDLQRLPSIKRAVLAGAAAGVVVFCAITTWAQTQYWKDEIRLYFHALEVTTDNYVAYTCLGTAADHAGAKEQAIAFYEQALKIAPGYAQTEYNLGTVLLELGRLTEAVQHLKVAAPQIPRSAAPSINLGWALFKLGYLEQAQSSLEQAVLIDPSMPKAHSTLGEVLLARDRVDEAIVQYRAALKTQPNNTAACAQLGVALQRKGRTAEALEIFHKVARRAPNDPEARINLGLALLDTKRFADAADQFQAGVRLKPTDSHMHYRLAVALSKQHKFKEAAAEYRETLRLAPDFGDAMGGLASILATAPDPALRNGSEAVKLAERACECSSDPEPSLLATLAAAYAEAGDFAKAVEICQKARDAALARGEQETASKAEEFTSLYSAGQPCREPF